MTATSEGTGQRDEPENFLDWMIPLARYRRVVIVVPLLLGALTVAVTLILPKKYTTTLSFVPVQTEGSVEGLASLAGQIGLSLPSTDVSTSPDFYAQLIRTPDILLELARAEYVVVHQGDTLRGTFVELYEIRRADEGRTLAEALRVLSSKVLTVGFDRQTSIVSVDVRTKWKDMSYQMATLLLARIDEFNLKSRQNRASAEQQFLERRIDSARVELREAENALQNFLLANRSYQSDPVLVFTYARLEREVTLKQSVYTTLIQSYEAARLASVRNTPSVSLVEIPAPALRFDRRRTVTKLAAGLIAGFVLAFGYISMATSLTRARASTPLRFATLDTEVRGFISEVRALAFWRRSDLEQGS